MHTDNTVVCQVKTARTAVADDEDEEEELEEGAEGVTTETTAPAEGGGDAPAPEAAAE